MAQLTDPVDIGGVTLKNRLYRAPLLECAGNGPDAVETLIEELEPTAGAGAGLIFQGASIVTPEGGCAAPNMTRVHDPAFVDQLSRLTDRIHDHGAKIFLQLGEGGLRSLGLWHAQHRHRNPTVRQRAVSRPPWHLRLADRLGMVDLRPDVLETAEVYDLADAFGRAAGYAVDAGYDGIHLSGANMGIIQQFLSPYYNCRGDEFGDGTRFLLAIRDAVRDHAGDIPLVTKVPAETAAPPFVTRHLDRQDGLENARRLAAVGFDALVPVEVSVYWDMSLIRGAYPDRAWEAADLQKEYAAVFGGPLRARAVALLNRLSARWNPHDPAWNESFCRAVREGVDVPVLCEGGIRSRLQCERLLGGGATPETAGGETGIPACDLVGMGRPFYAEPRLPARLLSGSGQAVGDTGGGGESPSDGRVLCESCNNCTVPQVAGEPGRCRTPHIVRERVRLEQDGVYETEQ